MHYDCLCSIFYIEINTSAEKIEVSSGTGATPVTTTINTGSQEALSANGWWI